MKARAAFGFSILLSLLSSIIVAIVFAWPRVRASDHRQALICLVAPHMFLRFIGIGFLVSGGRVRVTAESLGRAGRVWRSCRRRTCHLCHRCAG